MVKDVKTAKWLGWFVFHEIIDSRHILQSVYYALTKYGSPRKIFIKTSHFDSYITITGNTRKAGIHGREQDLIKILI